MALVAPRHTCDYQAQATQATAIQICGLFGGRGTIKHGLIRTCIETQKGAGAHNSFLKECAAGVITATRQQQQGAAAAHKTQASTRHAAWQRVPSCTLSWGPAVQASTQKVQAYYSGPRTRQHQRQNHAVLQSWLCQQHAQALLQEPPQAVKDNTTPVQDTAWHSTAQSDCGPHNRSTAFFIEACMNPLTPQCQQVQGSRLDPRQNPVNSCPTSHPDAQVFAQAKTLPYSW